MYGVSAESKNPKDNCPGITPGQFLFDYILGKTKGAGFPTPFVFLA
jgi:hypothetical protein